MSKPEPVAVIDLPCGCRINPPHPDRLCLYHIGVADVADIYLEVANRHRRVIEDSRRWVAHGKGSDYDRALAAIDEAMRAVISE